MRRKPVLPLLFAGLSVLTGLSPIQAEDDLRSARAESALRSVGREEALTELPAARSGEPFRAPLVVHGAGMTLDLEPYSSRSDDFKVVVIGEGGVRTVLDPGPVRTFRGTIPEIPGSHVSGGLFEDGLKLTIRLPDESVFRLEPGSRRGQYRVSECGADEEEGASCAVAPAPLRKRIEGMKSISAASTGENCASLGGCVADLLFDTDYSFYQIHGGNVSQIQTYLENVLVEVNEAFELFDIRHRLTQIVIRSSLASDPYKDVTTNADMLTTMGQTWQPGTNPNDVVHLFSAKNLGNYAYLGGVCNYSYGGSSGGMYSFSSSNGVSFCKKAGIVTHEIGHSWGATHVSCVGIMQNGAGDCDSSWCNASLTEIPAKRDTVDGICLELEVPKNSDYVSQSVPTSMLVEKSYDVSVTLTNVGSLAWDPIGPSCNAFRLGSVSGTSWRPGGRAELPTTVDPGDPVTINFPVKSPSAPGTYNFQWRMVHECVEWFGETTPNVAVSVTQLPKDMRFVSQSVPSTMVAGQTYTITMELKNVGTSDWNPVGASCNAYRLGTVTGTNWRLAGRAELPNVVPAGQTVTFQYTVTAPSTPGSYDFQWRMVHECVAWFGDQTPKVVVNVTP